MAAEPGPYEGFSLIPAMLRGFTEEDHDIVTRFINKVTTAVITCSINLNVVMTLLTASRDPQAGFQVLGLGGFATFQDLLKKYLHYFRGSLL